jgi:septation ring formation regulator EzrA
MFGEAVMKTGTGMKDISESISSFADGVSKLKNLGNISEIGKNLKELFSSMSDAVSSIGNASKYSNVSTAIKNLNIDKLIEFGKLAKTDLGNAGKNIVEGIKSLSKITIDENVDFGTSAARSIWTGQITKLGTGVVGAFEQLNIALGKVELDNVEVLAKVASTDMSKLGSNIEKGIQSLAKIDVDSSIQNLEKVSGVFEALYNALVGRSGILISTKLDEYSFLDPLKNLLDLDISKLQNVSSGLKAVVYNLSDIGRMGAPGLESLTSIFENLSKAMNALDVDKLRDISNVNVENLRKLSSVFQQPVSVGNTAVERTSVNSQQMSTQTTSQEVALSNKKLDEAIGILRQILNTSNQPVYIRVGDRTIEAIGDRIGRISDYRIATDNSYGRG